MAKNKFLRTCISCGNAKEKKKLLRFIVYNGEVVLDFYQKLNARGFYICKKKECFDKLNLKQIKKSLKKDFEFILDKEYIYSYLRKNLIKDLKTMVSICVKAGKVIGTTNNFIEKAKEKIYDVVFLAKDISLNSRRRIKPFIENLMVIDFFTKEELGAIINKKEVSILGVIKSDCSVVLKRKYLDYVNLFGGALNNG